MKKKRTKKKSSNPVGKQALELIKLILEIITLTLAIIKSSGK